MGPKEAQWGPRKLKRVQKKSRWGQDDRSVVTEDKSGVQWDLKAPMESFVVLEDTRGPQ